MVAVRKWEVSGASDDIREVLRQADELRDRGSRDAAIKRYGDAVVSLLESDKPRSAAAICRWVLELDPDHVSVRHQLARLHVILGQHEEAAAEFEILTRVYFSEGDITRGIEMLERVVEHQPASVGMRLRLAEIYSREGMVEKAVEHFRGASQRLLAEMRLDEFLRVAERLLYHQKDISTLRVVARLYLQRGETRRALKRINDVLRLIPGDALGMELLGDTFIAMKRFGKALVVAIELASRAKYASLNDRRIAVRLLRKAIRAGGSRAVEAGAVLAALEADVRRDEASADVSTSGIDIDLDLEISAVTSRSVLMQPPGADTAPPEANVNDGKYADAEAVLDEVRVYARYNMFKHAHRRLEGLLAAQPDHVESRILEGELFEQEGLGREAADAFVRAARMIENEETERALGLSVRALALDPNHDGADWLMNGLSTKLKERDERAAVRAERPVFTRQFVPPVPNESSTARLDRILRAAIGG